MITEDQFVELVADLVQDHISRDPDVHDFNDRESEDRWLARSLSERLRQYGYRLPEVII